MLHFSCTDGNIGMTGTRAIMKTTIDIVVTRLQTASQFSEIFGTLPKGSAKPVQATYLKKQFHALARAVHPDRSPGLEKEASNAFRLLESYRTAAEKAIEDGTYEQEFSPGEHDPSNSKPHTGNVLKSPKSLYILDPKILKYGDLTFVYKATNDKKEKVLIKVASSPEHNPMLEYEAKILKRFDETKALKVRRYVPEILDSFVICDKTKRFRANVMAWRGGFYSLTELKDHFPKGLEQKHAAWIFRRVLGQAAAAPLVDAIHCSIVPDHVLVNPVSHDPFHIGWIHALDKKNPSHSRMTSIIDRWKDFYPPEVFDKKPASTQIDIYMAAKCMIWLIGGNVKTNEVPKDLPLPIKKILDRCVHSNPKNRPNSAQEVLEEFTTTIRKLWGRSYRELVIPKR